MTESLADHAYEQLRAAIVTGRMAPGEPVQEVELGSTLRMSRTPVREALFRLELEGYVARDEASRLVVHQLEAREVAEIFMVRELLEGEAARLAALRISEEELARLDELVAADRVALRQRRVDELARLNDEIHAVIMVASRNRTLGELLGNLRGLVFGLNAFAVGSQEDQQRFVEEHAALVEYIRDGDDGATVTLLQGHLARARNLLVHGLEDNRGDDR